MSDIRNMTRDREMGLENFAAELTNAVYSVALRRQPKDAWLKMELALWKAVAESVARWAGQRPAAASAEELRDWGEALIVDLTESAFSIALRYGITGSLLELELGMYRAFRLVIRRQSRIKQTN
jgi:hypothetical protein